MVDAIATGTGGQKAYVGIRPGWHHYGLSGITTEQAQDPEWLIKAAGLDYKVLRLPVSYQDENGVFHNIPNRAAIVREDTGQAFTVQGSTYSVAVQPPDVIRLLANLLNEYDFKATFETLGAIHGGAKVWAMINTKDILIAGKRLLRSYIMAYNGYDGATAYGAKSIMTDVVCANTFAAALAEKPGELDVRIKHTTNMEERMLATLKAFKLLSQRQNEVAERLEILAQATARESQIETLFELVTPIPQGKDVEFKAIEKAKEERLALWRLFNTSPTIPDKNTLFGAVSAASEYIEHIEQRKGHNPDSTNKDWAFRRLEYMTDGLGQDRLAAVVTKAYAMAGIR